jgi:hypothetical protein
VQKRALALTKLALGRPSPAIIGEQLALAVDGHVLVFQREDGEEWCQAVISPADVLAIGGGR